MNGRVDRASERISFWALQRSCRCHSQMHSRAIQLSNGSKTDVIARRLSCMFNDRGVIRFFLRGVDTLRL